MRIAFATCTELAEGAPDDAVAIAELARRGHEVVPRVWNRDCVDDVDAVVLRSCWDYHHDPLGFHAWLSSIPVPMFNTARVAQWNLDKRYLRDLACQGIHVPVTAWLERGANTPLRSVLEAHGLDAAVVKPVVSMGGWETWRTSLATADDDAHFRALCSQRDVMVQAFAEDVLGDGEVSLVFFGGQFSHAIQKQPAAGEFRIHAEHGGRTRRYQPSALQIGDAQRIVRAAPGGDSILVARVDLIGPQLMELEVIDPELFFRFDDNAPARFADALETALA